MTDTERAALRAAAEKATPGEWLHEADIREDRHGKSEVVGWNIKSGTREIIGCEGILGDCEKDAAYIALAHPAAVLALLARLDRVEGALFRCLNYIENTESELGIKLGCGDAARAALEPGA